MPNLIEAASKLPLQDAAYFMWRYKSEIDRESAPPNQSSEPRANLSDPEVFGRVFRSAIAQVIYERDHAEFGSTFERIKKAHPDAVDDDVRAVVRSAVKFDADCTLNFSYTEAGLLADAERAVDSALTKHQGYSSKTRDEAVNHLCSAMR